MIIPALNEAAFIDRCLAAFVSQTYPADLLEVIVADGGSSDDTRSRVMRAAASSPVPVRLIDNPGRSAPSGMNAGIAVATGDVLIVFGAHAEAATDFVEANIRALRQTGAAAVGGPITTRGQGRVGTAIAAAVSHPFGVGDARFRYADRPGDVDTIAFAAYRRECMDLLGGFDTNRVLAEDDFFNYEIRRHGGRLYLTPAIRSTYYARATFRGLARQYLGYGRAKGRTMAEAPRSARPRHLVPAATVLGGAVLAVASVFSPATRLAMAGAAAGYLGLAAWSAGRAAAAAGRPWLGPLIGLAFPIIHVCYGLGTISGIVAAARRRTR